MSTRGRIVRDVAAAAGLEGLAVAVVLASPLWSGPGAGRPAFTLALVLGAALHLAAARLAVRAAARRAPLSRAERDVVTLFAVGVPVVGVLGAWWMPRPAGAPAPVDAHRAFEASREVPARAELALSGRWEEDLRARLDVESHVDVLRFGGRTMRSNLVQKLAERATARDLALLRRVLDDPEEELRIQAFLHLRDARNVWWTRVEEARAKAAAAEGASATADAWLAAARAHLALADSGALDPALAPFELARALEALGHARGVGGAETCAEAELLRLHLTARLGASTAAGGPMPAPRLSVDGPAAAGPSTDALTDPTGADRPLTELSDTWLLARAEASLRAGRLAPVRAAAAELVSRGRVLPPWMCVVCEHTPAAAPSAPVAEEVRRAG